MQCTNIRAIYISNFILSYFLIILPLDAIQSELLTPSFNINYHNHHHHHHYHHCHYHHLVVCLKTVPQPPQSQFCTERDLVLPLSVYNIPSLS